jgi:CRP-like cAMP-binding protein
MNSKEFSNGCAVVVEPPIETRVGERAGDGQDHPGADSRDRDHAAAVRQIITESGDLPRRSFDDGATVRPAGQPRNAVFVIESGWMFAARFLADGRRQVLEIWLPGQVVGLGEYGLDRPLSALHALGGLELLEIGWEAVRERLCASDDFSDHVTMLVAQERLLLEERLTSLGRRDASESLGHFLLEMHHRLRPPADRFRLPVTQTFLADLLGLTSVHVSRILTRLRDGGLVDMNDRGVHLLDIEALKSACDFDPAYLSLEPICPPG